MADVKTSSLLCTVGEQRVKIVELMLAAAALWLAVNCAGIKSY